MNKVSFHIGFTENYAALKILNYEVNWDQVLRGACWGGKVQMADIAIKAGADCLDQCFMIVCGRGDYDIIKLLIHHGAENWNGGLKSACCAGDIILASFLIRRGANNFKKALEKALKSGRACTAKYIQQFTTLGEDYRLLEKFCSKKITFGARFLAINKNLLDIARENNNQIILNFI
jgi:hypothetical protein